MVTRFREKPVGSQDRINGGFFVFEPAMLSLLTGDDCVLEADPLATLASRGQLAAYEHDGFWQPMDTLRDRDELNRLWDSRRRAVDACLTDGATAARCPIRRSGAAVASCSPGTPGSRDPGSRAGSARSAPRSWASRCPSCRPQPSLWEQLDLADVIDVRADITTDDLTGRVAGLRPVGRAPSRRPVARVGRLRPARPHLRGQRAGHRPGARVAVEPRRRRRDARDHDRQGLRPGLPGRRTTRRTRSEVASRTRRARPRPRSWSRAGPRRPRRARRRAPAT